ncbi:MAG: biotin--[acetyl-CoA-carboxylase] ligase [Alphaproteobacteria bacterium]
MSRKQADLLNDYHLLSFETLDSTNEEAKRLAAAGGGHGAVIWAKQQTKGKGRMGRSWVSDEGNLFVSVLLQPEKPLSEASQLSFVAAVAMMESIEDMLPEGKQLRSKWPNDILVGDKKLGGILLESLQVPDGGKWVIVGVGINIESHPKKTEFPSTCLKKAGVELISAKIILSRFIHHFIERYNEWNAKGFSPVRAAWLESAWGMGKQLTARLPDEQITGIAEGINKDGALILKTRDGKERHILAADVFPAGRQKAEA